jgi:hypothetical protein
MVSPQRLPKILSTFCNTARELCQEIDLFQPELVIALAHSGWAPVAAAKWFWESTRSQAFPPAIRINLGREKQCLYEPFGHLMWTGGLSVYEEAELWEWVTTRKDWVSELRQMAAAEMGGFDLPKKILLVDEFFYTSRTAILALGLALEAFHDSRAYVVAGRLDNWCEVMAHAWLELYHPKILASLPQSNDEFEHGAYNKRMNDAITLLVPGTEDSGWESLAWKPISLESLLLEPLKRMAKKEEWLMLPAWAEQSIHRAVFDYAAQDNHESIPKSAGRWLKRKAFTTRHWIIKEALCGHPLTRRRVADACGISPGRAGKILNELYKNVLAAADQGLERVYSVRPGIQTIEQEMEKMRQIFQQGKKKRRS